MRLVQKPENDQERQPDGHNRERSNRHQVPCSSQIVAERVFLGRDRIKAADAITEAAHHDLIGKAGQRESQRDFAVLDGVQKFGEYPDEHKRRQH